MSFEMSNSVSPDGDTDVAASRIRLPFCSPDVAAKAGDYRTTANYWALIELAELKDHHQRQVEEIKQLFRRPRATSSSAFANQSNVRRRSSSTDIAPSSTTTTDDSEVSSSGEGGEGEGGKQTAATSHERRFARSVQPDVRYRLPVCLRGQTANYPSPLHAILAQYAQAEPCDAANDVASNEPSAVGDDDGPSQPAYVSPPSGTCDNDATRSSESGDDTAERLLPPAAVEQPTNGYAAMHPPMNRRLAEVRRSASSASYSSSEGYCSGGETDSAAECTCPRSTNAAVRCRCDRDIDVDRSRTDGEDAATVALTRLLSSLANAKTSGDVRRTLSNRKTKRRIAKANRRLSPLSLSDDDVFVRDPSSKQENVIFV
jgi:hypothetical protein